MNFNLQTMAEMPYKDNGYPISGCGNIDARLEGYIVRTGRSTVTPIRGVCLSPFFIHPNHRRDRPAQERRKDMKIIDEKIFAAARRLSTCESFESIEFREGKAVAEAALALAKWVYDDPQGKLEISSMRRRLEDRLRKEPWLLLSICRFAGVYPQV